MNITMMRDEIRAALGVSDSGLKTIINRGTLQDRLLKVGLELITTYKLGRNTIYEVLPIDLDYWENVQNHYGIKKINEHDAYTLARLSDDGVLKPRAKIIRDNSIDITNQTAKRYDDILESENILRRVDGGYIKTLVISDIKNAVYRMIDERENIIYIGKTNNLKKRIFEHMSYEKEGDWFNKYVKKIEYLRFNKYGDCSIAEMYFIMKLKPKYNKEFTQWDTSLNIKQFEEANWCDSNFKILKKHSYTYINGDMYEVARKELCKWIQ